MALENTKITILGDGGWGTALALLLKTKGYNVSLWGVFPDNIENIKKHKENKKFLPGIKLPNNISFTSNLKDAVCDAEFVVLAIPSRFLRNVLVQYKDILNKLDAGFISVVKGLEDSSLKRMSEVILEELQDKKLAVLSGPSIAPEVAKGVPTTVVVTSKDDDYSNILQDVFRTERFRVYTNSDLIGVELGGILKNIIAIASGISDGLGFGSNTKAAILTRGLLEMTRIGVALGANKNTFQGLSGLGDLVTTCISPVGRNRTFGEEIGRGKKPQDILKTSVMEIEGAWSARAALKLGQKYNIDLPITREVVSVVFEGKSPRDAVNKLMLREPKQE